MFNNHTISVIFSLDSLGPEINNINFLTIASLTTDYPNLQNIYDATILAPPTELLMRWADGDQISLQYNYPQYLMSADVDSYIVALLANLTVKNVVLYIPSDAFQIFGSILLNHLRFMYGIICNIGQTMCSFDITKIPFIISKFYMMDLMDKEEYLKSYPPYMMLPDFVINKLAADFHLQPMSFIDYKNYFNKMIADNIKTKQPQQMCEIIEKKDSIW